MQVMLQSISIDFALAYGGCIVQKNKSVTKCMFIIQKNSNQKHIFQPGKPDYTLNKSALRALFS